MAEDLQISGGDKKGQYLSLIPQIQSLVQPEPDLVANMANTCAALKEQFNFLWIGFYLANEHELVLGPFQGPVACTRIAYGRGVCGTAWKEQKTLIIPDVDAFPGHIACSSLSRSEIVIPLWSDGRIAGVLDADSDQPAAFDETDEMYLKQIMRLIGF